MTIQYFEDTDTLYVVFKDTEVRETKDLDENTLVEYDARGNLVSMTIEHARERVDMGSFSFQPVAAMRPVA
jgi:YD repeat-containing protein